MALCIIGTIRNKLNEKAIVSFYMLDTNYSSITELTYTELKDAIKNGTVVCNAKITDKNTIEGTYYDLKDLSYKVNDKEVQLNKYIIIERYANDTYLICKYTLNSMDIKVCDSATKETLFEKGQIYNESYRKNNSNKENIQTNNETQEVDKLDAEAYNINKVWSLDDFKSFMDKHGWRYKLRPRLGFGKTHEYTVEHIDPNCEIVHLPLEVTGSSALFEDIPVNKPTIIFGPMMKYFTGLYSIPYLNTLYPHGIVSTINIGETYSIKKVVDMDKTEDMTTEEINKLKNMPMKNVDITSVFFQESTEEQLNNAVIEKCCDFSGLSYINILDKANVPRNRFIKNLYNFCNINEISVIQCSSLHYSLNYLTIAQKDVAYDTKTSMCVLCKSKLTNAESVLVIGPNVTKISSSIVDVLLQKLDIIYASKLTEIRQSISKIDNIEELDFSYLHQQFNYIRSSFSFCKNLKRLVLPPNIRDVGEGCLDNSPGVEEVVIPDTIEQIMREPFVNGCRVIYPKKVNEVNSRYFCYYKNALRFEPVFNSVIENIDGNMSSAEGKIEDLKLPKTIKKMSQCCFEYSKLSEFDSIHFPNLHVIPDFAFRSSNLEVAIFRENITDIGVGIFDGCSSLRTVIFGDSITKMENGLLSKCNTTNIIKVYIVAKSIAKKKIRKSRNLAIIEVGSIEEAYKMEYNSETSESKQYKFDIMLKDTKFECLLNEEYRTHIGYLYKLFNSMNKNEPYLQDETISLDTSKFGSIPLNNISGLKRLVEECKQLASKNGKLLSNRREFITLSNFITSISNNYIELLNSDIINKLNTANTIDNADESYEFKYYRHLLMDEDAQILLVRLQRHAYSSSQAHVIVMIYNNQLVYITPFLGHEYIRYQNNAKKALITQKNYREEVNIGLGTVLMPGDNIGYACYDSIIINSKKIPYQLLSMAIANVESTCRLIGVKNLKKHIGKSTERYKIRYDALFIELINQRLIEGSCKIDFSDDTSYEIDNIEIQNVKRVDTIDNIGSFDKEYLSDLLNGFNNKLNNNKLAELLMSDNKYEEIYNNIENYDTKGDLSLIYLGELVYQNNIKGLDSINGNISILKRILDSHLYTNANISMNYIKKNQGAYKQNEVRQLSDKGEFLIEFEVEDKDKGKLYVTGITSINTTMSSKKFLMGSVQNINKNIQMLYMIGQSRSAGKHNEYAGINNKKIDINDYFVVCSKSLYLFNRLGFKLHLAVNLYSADTYLIGDYWDTDFYKVLRLKNFLNGILLFRYYTCKYETKQECPHNQLIEVMYSLIDDEEVSSFNVLDEVRKSIMNGLPNNYPYTGRCPIDIVDMLAKQPKDTSKYAF